MAKKKSKERRARKSKTDWRKLPRKPAGTHRSVRISLRFTHEERAEIHALAEEARRTLADCVITAALRHPRR